MFYKIDLPSGNIEGQTPVKGGQQVQVLNNVGFNESDCCHSSDETDVINLGDDFGSAHKSTWVPPAMNTSSYVVPIVHAFADGRLFYRGFDAIYCFDMRKQPGVSSSLPDGKLAGFKSRLTQAQLVKVPGGTLVRFQVPQTSYIRVDILNAATGKKIHSLPVGTLPAGMREVRVNETFPKGNYLVRVKGNGFEAYERMISMH